MPVAYRLHTQYKDAEDFKRLDFIVSSIRKKCPAAARILDIGCGNGNISRALGSLGYRVVGVDIDPESVEKAKQQNTFPNVRYEISDAQEYISTGSFDAVVCSEVLEHLTDPEALVKTISQILEPGGLFIATVPNGYGPRESFITKPAQWLIRNGCEKPLIKIKKSMGYGDGTLQSSNADLTHVRFFTKKGLFRLVQNEGFRLEQFRKADTFERVFPFSLLTRRIYALQKLDCFLADYMPAALSSGFYTSWIKTGG
jgi:SAM-dependent methyltransferase